MGKLTRSVRLKVNMDNLVASVADPVSSTLFDPWIRDPDPGLHFYFFSCKKEICDEKMSLLTYSAEK
jgi:hypothetical protein